MSIQDPNIALLETTAIRQQHLAETQFRPFTAPLFLVISWEAFLSWAEGRLVIRIPWATLWI